MCCSPGRFRSFPEVVPAALAGLAMFGLAAKLLRGVAEPGELQGVLRGIPHNVTTEMDLRLWDLTQRIRADESAATGPANPANRPTWRRATCTGDLPAVLQDGLADFLHQYGHRAVAEIDLGVPRWSDDPTHILGVLANYLRLTDPDLAPDAMFARGDREANGTDQDLATEGRPSPTMARTRRAVRPRPDQAARRDPRNAQVPHHSRARRGPRGT